ncbi:MAG: 2-oxo acid dehydrogenase subunit E2 [Rhodobacteraceae bacterium]|nr:2-oxo acid dehydrogenase subunit E2 [Paracoccaceae bacterium]
MVQIKIRMPDVGEGVTEAEIEEWNVKSGDLVKEDDALAAVMTDKATVEIPSPVDGKVISTSGQIGDVIAVGETIVVLEVFEDQAAPGLADTDRRTHSAPGSNGSRKEKPGTPVRNPSARPLAAPAVRRRAKEAGVNLSDVSGSGPGGRITVADLQTWIDDRLASTLPESDMSSGDDFEEFKILGLRRKIAEHMQLATQSIAHMTYVEEVDVTELENLREKLNVVRIGNDETRLTILPFIMIAMIHALKESPRLNSHYDAAAGLVRQYSSVHLGMATQTSNGLLVPVIRNAGAFDLSDLAAEIIRLADAAKSGTISRQELSGSTITLSTLGKMGGLMSTPIINAPEVAIVGVNKIAVRQVWKKGSFVARKMMNLSSSFDHRIVDGWDAAVFIQKVKVLIEDPAWISTDG